MRRRLIRLIALLVVAGCLAPGTAAAAPSGEPAGVADGGRGGGRLVKPAAEAHPDVAPQTASTLPSDSYNPITFDRFQTGDLVVVLGTATGHAGLFDRSLYSSIYSSAVWSANIQPFYGVQRETCIKYRNNPRAYGLRVSGHLDHAYTARNYARSWQGRPYSLAGAKTDERTFYCSKVDWLAWRKAAGVDLDADGGFWVWPVDLLNDSQTALFGYWN